MKLTDTTERGLEVLIEESLVNESGYGRSYPSDYDRDLCLNQGELVAFIQETQPTAWATIQKRGEDKFLKRLNDQIRQKGIIDILRKGIKDLDLTVFLYYKRPDNQDNARLTKLYAANRFSVCRQLRYSADNQNSLDMVLLINGLPVVTMELKNPWTGQTVKNAIQQYKTDRSQKEPLFQLGRCIVHLAVDPDLVYMTTHLRGDDTSFLPFNKGTNDNGAGNPLNPAGGLKTDYLWKEILTKPRLSRIIEDFAALVAEKDEDTGKVKQKLIFPRYHQLQVVDKLIDHARQHGTGQKYLIQHSAGSGKSNSITWLAHQLVSLHGASTDQSVFNSVIVVTDRRVLDKQIRDNIKSFGQVSGVVEAITEGSQQLRTALELGKRLIITTIQKFPHIIEKIGDLTAKRFAIIIDEAHSSQSGQTASKMNLALSSKDDEEELTTEDLINATMEGRKMLRNASYFAFTATPKNKTLELFGEQRADGKFHPVDLYSMKQAIEEGFILDVLKNYTTYSSYYKINKTVEDNPLYDTKQAQKRLRAYVEGHPFSIKEKSKLMLDHFHTESRKQIKGQAKAMVVTKSIQAAIQYYFAFREYLAEINSPYKAIVAFSGKRTMDGQEYDEARLNGFPGNDIPQAFKKAEYRFLVVANKYQTGFDQPLLHTMYVDKKLADVQAVQTLSRLNRSAENKEDTFVLDFYNTVDDIQAAFEPFYTTTILSRETDANKLNDLQESLDTMLIYTGEEVSLFTNLLFQKAPRPELESIIDRSVERFKQDLSEDEQVDFIVKGRSFMKTYEFLSKILTFNNLYWERLYWLLKYLLTKVQPPAQEDLAKNLLEAIEMDSYRLSKTTTDDITLTGEGEIEPTPPIMRGKQNSGELDELAAIINEFNRRFGIDTWTDDDKVKLFLTQQLPLDMASDAKLLHIVNNSDKQNAKISSDQRVEDLMQDVIWQYTDLYKKFTDDPDFKRQLQDYAFERLVREAGAGKGAQAKD